MTTNLSCLNPYSIGIWSATMRTRPSIQLISVLILILLEYGLRPHDAQRLDPLCWCLNPYSIGIWSATGKYKDSNNKRQS